MAQNHREKLEIKDKEGFKKAMSHLERYEDKMDRGQNRSLACRSTKVTQMSMFWDKHAEKVNQ